MSHSIWDCDWSGIGQQLVSTMGSDSIPFRVAQEIGADRGYIVAHPGHDRFVTTRILTTTVEAILRDTLGLKG